MRVQDSPWIGHWSIAGQLKQSEQRVLPKDTRHTHDYPASLHRWFLKYFTHTWIRCMHHLPFHVPDHVHRTFPLVLKQTIDLECIMGYYAWHILQPMYKYTMNQKNYFFMPPAWKVRRGHLVIGSSVCLSVRLLVIPSRLQTKCNIQSLGDDTVTKLGL